jgi:chromosome segregation ATPase
MTTVAFQGEDENYQAYINKDTIVVDPYGNEVTIKGINTGKTSGQIQKEIDTEVHKWDRQMVYTRKQLPETHSEYLQTNMRVGNPKERGYIPAKQWDRYDVGFDPAEVADPVRREQAMNIVKDWAQNCELVGRAGKRAYTYQDWHLDGASGMPHIRVVVNRVVYDEHDKNVARNSMSISKGGDRNMDIHNLNVRLQNAGFSAVAQVGAKHNGQQINPAISQNQVLPADQVIAKADQALTDAGVQPPAPKHDKDFTLLDHGRKDLLNQRYQELVKEVDEKRREMERVQAAMETEEQIAALLNERGEFERKVNDLGVEVEQKTAAINDFAEVVRTDLAERDPEFAERTAELPAEEVVKAGLEKHVEITNTLQAELDTRLAELDQAVQELGTTRTEMDDALAQYFETEELAELEGKSAFEKVDALGEKLTRQVEETASQLRAKTEDWLNTNKELADTRAERDAKAEELTTAKADIDGAIALLRNDMPELFKNNPDLEKSMRASMEAAIKHSKSVEQERDELASKLQETEAAKEQLEEQNDTLVNQNKELKTDLEKMQDERDEARRQLAEVTAKLTETTKRVETLEKVEGNIRNLLKREREEGWQSMSAEEAVETLTRKYDDISRDKITAVGQVEFYKEQITTLNTKVDKLEERLDEQRRETQEQIAKQQQAHAQQMAELVKGQVGQNQGNVPTQGGQPQTTPTQGPTGNPPQSKGPSISEE